ncbi:MAG: YraN family protein [Flavobacteriia bacterium]|nr:YraN family protein [Flavobacteriia bacterium]
MDNLHNKSFGKAGEDAAVVFLERKGYRIIKRNYRAARDEIDIIAKQNNVLVIVEVKTRATNTYSVPEDFITPHKETCLLRAAEAYIEDEDWHGDTRFDLIAIYHAGNELQFIHIEDAFYPRA